MFTFRSILLKLLKIAVYLYHQNPASSPKKSDHYAWPQKSETMLRKVREKFFSHLNCVTLIYSVVALSCNGFTINLCTPSVTLYCFFGTAGIRVFLNSPAHPLLYCCYSFRFYLNYNHLTHCCCCYYVKQIVNY